MLAAPAAGLVLARPDAILGDPPATPATSSHLDVCDLSFLIPPGPLSISLSKEKPGEFLPILSRRLFDMFVDFRQKGHPKVANLYESMVITAVRFDPCGPRYPENYDIKDTLCTQPNLRLIAQPVVDGRPTTAALHMVFALGVKTDQAPEAIFKGIGFDPGVRDGAVAELKRMKARNLERGVSTAGVPVDVHPAFAGKTLDGPAAAGFVADLERFIRKYALESSYFVTAIMYTVDPSSTPDAKALEGKERWEWEKAFVVRFGKDGKPLPAPVLMLAPVPGIADGGKPLTFQNFTADSDRRAGATLSARPSLEHGTIKNIDLLKLLDDRSPANPADLQTGVDISDLLENPTMAAVQTEDCVSCHLTTPGRTFALAHASAANVKRSLRFAFDAKAAGLVDSLGPDAEEAASASGYHVMSLAFFKGKPSISQRTVFETLQAAHLINRNYP
ncbi:hypothetical protein [Paludisphaera rhizosphaerae]|uniref:hypothetical protein n=1 Tax=Paludisphaera rhizosphaerae TaxID=2711216 RepID=UPI0013E9C10E|nr:hypothetical protein [Paludisphaera rhizosphaerae]